MNPLFLLLGILSAVLAIIGLFRPFLGLFVLLIIHFVQPGELIPALAPFRIELVYGGAIVGIVLWRQFSDPERPSFKSEPVFHRAFILIGVAILSVPLSVWKGGAAKSVMDLVINVIILVVLGSLIETKTHLRVFLWLAASLSFWYAYTGYAAYQRGEFYTLGTNAGSGLGTTLNRAEGVNSMVGGPNELAGFLLALLPFQVALVRSTRNIFLKVLLVASGYFSLFVMSRTGSRIAMLGLIAFSIYYILRSKHKILLAVVILVVGSYLWLSMPAVYQNRYLTMESYAEGGKLDGSNQFRMHIWISGFQIFIHNPVIGVGVGQFSTAYGMLGYALCKHCAWMNPHNLLIQVGCEMGILGLIAFGGFITQVAKGIRSVMDVVGDDKSDICYQAAVSTEVMFLGVCIMSVVGHTFFRPYWYLLGGLVVANRYVAFHSKGKSLAPATESLPGNKAPLPQGLRTLAPSEIRNSRRAEPLGAHPPFTRS
jgi:O-antigen ligase